MDLINLSIGVGTGDNEPAAPGSHGFLDSKIQECKSFSGEFQVEWENSSMSSVPEVGRVAGLSESWVVCHTQIPQIYHLPPVLSQAQERDWICQFGWLIHNPLSSLSRKALPHTHGYFQLLYIEFSAFSEAVKKSLKFCLAS